MQQFEKVQAYFEPKRVETLRDEAKPFIGMLMTFEALWLIEESDGGPYVGQWAMGSSAANGIDCLPFGWVPQEDIRIVTPNV